jgi:hypothetical protein
VLDGFLRNVWHAIRDVGLALRDRRGLRGLPKE